MQPNYFLRQIKQLLYEVESSQVIAALRQDALIWNSLQVEDFRQKAVSDIGGQAAGWNPARLAWIALGNPVPFDLLLEVPMQPLPSDLRQKAAAAFETAYAGHEKPADLEKSGLAALALRERRRIKGSWVGISTELVSGGASLSLWKTTLACLVSFTPDPADLLRSLLPVETSVEKAAAHRQVVLHALLCTPMDQENQCSLLTDLLAHLSPGELALWLDDLTAAGRTALAQRLAQSLVFTSTAKALPVQPSENEKISRDPLSMPLPLSHIDECLKSAHITGYAKNGEDSIQLLSQAWEDARCLQAQIAAHLARAAQAAGDPSTALHAWEQAAELVPESTLARTGLAVSLADAGRHQDALAALPPDSSLPSAKMTAAYLAMKSGDHVAARTYALDASQSVAAKSIFSLDVTPDTSDLIGWILTLLGLDLPEPAIELLSALIEERPADVDLLDLLAQAHAKNNSLQAACEAAETALSIAPSRKNLRRQYAGLLETANSWEHAFVERSRLTDSAQPDTDDLLALARCAIEVRQPELTVQLCQDLLSKGLEDYRVYTLLGSASMAQGSMQQAIGHFTQATVICPESPEAWLALSKAQTQIGEAQKSHETLRSAVLAADPSAEIYMALAQASLDSGSLSEALPYLRKAADLHPGVAHIQYRLGETLYRLGHLPEANQVLKAAHTQCPEHKGIALVYAHTLLAQGERKQALPALLACLTAPEQRSEAALVLGRTLVELIETQEEDILPEPALSPDVKEALRPTLDVVTELLQAHPEQAEAHAITGLLHLAAKEPTEAFQALSSLAETGASLPVIWHWRIRFGLGRAALAVDEVETALAALQEAAAMQPEHAKVHRNLADAFLAAELPKETLRVSKIALRNAPHDLTNLAWYARLMLKLGFLGDAAETLEHATQAAPSRSDILLWLGQVQLQNGDMTGVTRSLSRLTTLPSATVSQLQQASDLLLEAEDLPGAIACLEAALKTGSGPSIEILSNLIALHQQAGNLTAALDALQQARDIDPDNLQLALVQSDLLVKINHNLAALDILHSTIDLIERKRKAGVEVEPGMAAGVHIRAAALQRANGDLTSAIAHAETALVEMPGDIQSLNIAANLAYAMLDSARLDALIASLSFDNLSTAPASAEKLTAQVGLLCTCTEHLLESDKADEAKSFIDLAVRLAPTQARILADQARLLALTGEARAAAVLYDQALQAEGSDTWSVLADAEAGLALEKWQASLERFNQASVMAPQEPRPWLQLARALTLQAEAQHIADALNVVLHAPGETALSEENYRAFEQSVLHAGRLASTPEIIRWRTRGQAAFHPDAQTARELELHLSDDSDMAAYVAVLSSTHNLQGVSRASQTYPGSPEVLLQLALALRETEPETALAIATILVEREPDDPRHHVLLSGAIQFDLFAALKAIEAALMVWPDEPLWQKTAAEMCEQAGDGIGASDHWEQVAELRPDDPQVALAYGQAALKQNNFGQAILMLNKAVSLDEACIDAWMALAGAQQKAGGLKPALDAVERAVTLDSQNLDALALYGEIALESGQPDLAAQRAQDMLCISPNDPQGQLLYIRAQAASGNHAEALAAIEHALSGASDPFHLLFERARLKQQLHGAAAALPCWVELSQAYPDQPEVLAPLAAAQAETGQSAEAEKTAQAAIALDPDQPALHLLLGRLQRMKGQLDQAIHHLSEAIRQSPIQVEAYLELGRAYHDRRDYVQALKVYRQATHVAPDDSRPFYQAGLVMRENKDYLGAESMLRRAAKLAPEEPNIRRQLGAIIALNLVHHPEESTILP